MGNGMEGVAAARTTHQVPCEDLRKLEKTVVRQDQQVENLTGWQRTQNGTLAKLDERIGELAERIEGVFRQILLAVMLALLSALVAAGGTIAMLLSKGP